MAAVRPSSGSGEGSVLSTANAAAMRNRLASEIGSYLPLPRTLADRQRTGDGRKSIAERYASLEDYLGRISLAAVSLVTDRFLLAEDVPATIERAKAHYEWATGKSENKK